MAVLLPPFCYSELALGTKSFSLLKSKTGLCSPFLIHLEELVLPNPFPEKELTQKTLGLEEQLRPIKSDPYESSPLERQKRGQREGDTKTDWTQYLWMTGHSIQESAAIIVQLRGKEKKTYNRTVRKKQMGEKRVMHSSTPSEVRTSALANRLMIKFCSIT